MRTRSFVGLDMHKATIWVSVGEDGRNGEVRFLGAIPNTPHEVTKLAKLLPPGSSPSRTRVSPFVNSRHLGMDGY